MKQVQAFFCLLLIAFGCNTEEKQNGIPDKNASRSVAYAERFTIDEEGRILTVNYPFGSGLASFVYHITPPEGTCSITLQAHDTPTTALVDCPMRIAVLSTTHLPFIEALGLTNKLVAIDNAKRVYSETIRERVADGRIAEIGNVDGSINYEKLIAAKPDLVILSGTGNLELDDSPKLRELKLLTLVDVEWKENHPLGRAEWIKVFGLLCGKTRLADSLFDGIAKRYNLLKQKAALARSRPTVVTGKSWKGTWFVPGGRSFAARLLADAASQYIWETDSSVGSLPLKFEAVYTQAAGSQYWVNLEEYTTQAQLLADDERYANFSAFNKQQLYNYNNRVSSQGGNDYWERGTLEPDEVLADLVQIFHPDVIQGRQMKYYRKLPPN